MDRVYMYEEFAESKKVIFEKQTQKYLQEENNIRCIYT